MDDTQVWNLRAQVCNNPSCDNKGICHYTIDGDEMRDDWNGGLGENDTPKIEINIYSQTGSFSHCWDALGDIISQCNRAGNMAGEWDYDGQAYWIVNNMDSDGNGIATTQNLHKYKYGLNDLYDQNWVMASGTYRGDYYCVGTGSDGCSSNTEVGTGIGGCSSTYTWSKSVSRTLTIGGSIGGGGGKEGGILNAVASFLPSYAWTTTKEVSVSQTCQPNIKCFVVQASPLMGYSFGITIGMDGVNGYGRLTFNPYHLDTSLYDSQTEAPQLLWKCDGPCTADIEFNPGCPT